MASSTQIAQTRRLVYGGSTRSGSLSAGDVAWFFDNNANLYLGAAAAANAEQINAIAGGRKKVGDLEVDPSVTAAGWGALSKQLRLRGVRQVSPFSGGISRNQKAATETDADWDEPESRRGQFDYNSDSTGGRNGV